MYFFIYLRRIYLFIYLRSIYLFICLFIYSFSYFTYLLTYVTVYHLYTANPLYSDICYNSRIRYNVNSVCTKISGSCSFSLTVPCYYLGKRSFWVFVKIAFVRIAEAILTNTQNVCFLKKMFKSIR